MRSRRHGLAVGLTFVGLLSSCQVLFGSFTLSTEDPAVISTNLCATDSFRCVGPWLYRCTESNDGWQEANTCATPEHCDSRAGRCRACIPETHRCNGSRLEFCTEGGDWTLLETCTTSDECNLNSDSCRPCTPGEYQCNQESLLQCSGSQTWEQVQLCSNVAACVVREDRMSGECRAPVCDSGENHLCNGAQLLRCTAARDSLIEIDTCATPSLCDAAAANRNRDQGVLASCLEKCAPGVRRCNGAILENCDAATGLWLPLETCGSPDMCNLTAGTCEACTEGSVECSGRELRRCTNGVWQVEQDCQQPQLCDPGAARCLPPKCPVPNQAVCRTDGLYRCLPDQSEWKLLEFCEGDLCNANDQDCDKAACSAGQTRCFANSFQRCSDDLRSWLVIEQCADGETCSLDGCQASSCAPGSFRCNDLYLEQCTDSGWQHKNRCETRELCDAANGVCKPPGCGGTLGEFNCLGQSLRDCPPSRIDWADIRDCSTEGLVCDASTGTCK